MAAFPINAHGRLLEIVKNIDDGRLFKTGRLLSKNESQHWASIRNGRLIEEGL